MGRYNICFTKKKSLNIEGQKTKALENHNSICAAKAALGTMLYFVTVQKNIKLRLISFWIISWITTKYFPPFEIFLGVR